MGLAAARAAHIWHEIRHNLRGALAAVRDRVAHDLSPLGLTGELLADWIVIAILTAIIVGAVQLGGQP